MISPKADRECIDKEINSAGHYRGVLKPRNDQKNTKIFPDSTKIRILTQETSQQ
jgi:hypothetical protein